MTIKLNDSNVDVPPSMAFLTVNKSQKRIISFENFNITFETVDAFTGHEEIIFFILDFRRFQYVRIPMNDYYVKKIYDKKYYFMITITIDENEKILSLLNVITQTAETAKRAAANNSSSLFLFRDELGETLENNTYPYERDHEFQSNIGEQISYWNSFLADVKVDTSKYEMSIYLHNPELWNLSSDKSFSALSEEVLDTNHLLNSKLFNKPFTRVYLGNEFCMHLQPSTKLVYSWLNKSLIENFEITICTPPISEQKIDSYRILLKEINDWCIAHDKTIEVVFNDWGILKLLLNYKVIIPVLGRLLNSRKKDPRLFYAWGYNKNKDNIKQNSLNELLYQNWLNKNNITRFEFELYEYENIIPETGKHSIHFPMYQIGTAVACTLNALCRNGNRYHQNPIINCPMYCRDFALLYPKHLNMFGYQNSVLGFNQYVNKWLNKYSETQIDRLVYFPIRFRDSKK